MTQIILNIILSASLYSLISFGFYLHYRCFKFFNLAAAGYIALSSYLLYFYFTLLSLNIFISISLALVTSSVIAFFSEFLLFKILKLRSFDSSKFLIASLGLYLIFDNIIPLIFNNEAKLLQPFNVKFILNYSNFILTDLQLGFIISTILIFIFIKLLFTKTYLGKSIKGVISNSELSNVFGLNQYSIQIKTIIIYVFVLSVSGIIIALDKSITPSLGFPFLLYGIIVSIISGMRLGFSHLLIGSLFLAFIQHITAYYFGYKWLNAISFVFLIFFLYARPYGFIGKKLKKTEL